MTDPEKKPLYTKKAQIMLDIIRINSDLRLSEVQQGLRRDQSQYQNIKNFLKSPMMENSQTYTSIPTDYISSKKQFSALLKFLGVLESNYDFLNVYE